MSKFNSTLTAERLRELLHYDPETGAFTNIVSRGAAAKAGTIAGQIDKGYLKIKIDGVMYLGHRLAWLYMTGGWPLHGLDHIDRRKINNCWVNLRDANQTVNNHNRSGANKNNKNGFLGVSQNSKTGFIARIRVNKVLLHLGSFSSPEEAHIAYLAAKRLHHAGNKL